MYLRPAHGFAHVADRHLLSVSKPQGGELGLGKRATRHVPDVTYLEAAEGTLRLAGESMRRIPYAHASLLAALDEYLIPPETLVIRGEGEDLNAWQRVAQAGYRPRRLVLAIPAGEVDLPGTLAGMVPSPGIRAYRCAGINCSTPIEDFGTLQAQLAP